MPGACEAGPTSSPRGSAAPGAPLASLRLPGQCWQFRVRGVLRAFQGRKGLVPQPSVAATGMDMAQAASAAPVLPARPLFCRLCGALAPSMQRAGGGVRSPFVPRLTVMSRCGTQSHVCSASR